MSASAAMKKSKVLSESVLEKATPKARQTEKTANKASDKIAQNPFYKSMFNAQLTQEARKSEIAKLMTSTMDRAVDRENIKAYEEFREWLAAQNTELAKQNISLTNVNTLAEMQAVVKEMNEGLMEFNDLMAPIMDISDSIYQLRTNGSVVDAFREIKADEQRQAEIDQKIGDLQDKVRQAKSAIQSSKDDKAAAAAKRTWFGFGGPSEAARKEMARADITITDTEQALSKLEASIKDLQNTKPGESELGDLSVHKDRLKELLDLSGDQNRDRIIALRDAASSFIATSEERTGSLRVQFADTIKQVEHVVDNNSGMNRTYLILNEGLVEAEKSNSELRKGLVEKEDESQLERSTREERQRILDNHISMVKTAQGETIATSADLQQQAVRVNTMHQAMQQQINTARTLNTQGVAATADRLAVVLNAISGAALGEASAVAEDTLKAMRDSTSAVAQREVIRVAMGADRMNTQLQQITDELADLSEVQRTATAIARNGMSDMQEHMDTLQKQASEMRNSLRDFVAVAADSAADGSEEEEAPATNHNSVFASV